MIWMKRIRSSTENRLPLLNSNMLKGKMKEI
jgi:hypothetical protein